MKVATLIYINHEIKTSYEVDFIYIFPYDIKCLRKKIKTMIYLFVSLIFGFSLVF
jgi:hypothetical protein